MWSAGEGDDKERFFADLRAMRDTAALGYEELAARAHYPSHILKEAENGPSLPGLPILAAYVRACEGDVPEWEERWRRLGFEVRADPGLPVRPAGTSPAAVAGARAGVSVAPPDTYDPDRIRAALRGSHLRAGQATLADAGLPTGEVAGWDRGARADTGWGEGAGSGKFRSAADASRDAAAGRGSAAGQGTAAANGNHQHPRRQDDAPFGPAVPEMEDPAAAAEALRQDPFSATWLHDSKPIPRVRDTEPGRQERAGGDRASPEGTGRPPPGFAGFWTPVKAAAAPADVQPPSLQPPAAEPSAAGTLWSAFTPSSPKVTADPGYGPVPDLPPRAEPAAGQGAVGLAGPDPGRPRPVVPARPGGVSSAAAAPSRTPEPAVPQPTPAPPGESRPDRYYPLRLLTVIVVAALIGSVLVLLLR
jgi:hypothetical protein